MPTKTSFPILHFNDVYRVTPQKLNPLKPSETIDVTQFAALVNDLRDRWPQRPDGAHDGLFLFSGDVFSPSMESSVTRGSHMVFPDDRSMASSSLNANFFMAFSVIFSGSCVK